MTVTIVHVAGYSPEYPGNFIASQTRLRQSIRSRGWDMVLVLPEAARHHSWCAGLLAEGWRICFLPADASVGRCARLLAKIMTQEGAQVVHAHFVRYDLAAWLAARLAARGRNRIQVVWHVHSEPNMPKTVMRWTKNFIKYRWMGRSAWLIAVGDSVARQLVAAGCAPMRVSIVENGIDLSHATRPATRQSSLVTEIGDSGRLILMFGIEPLNKGVDIALHALGELAHEDSGLTLGIVGRQKLRDYLRDNIGATLPSWLRVLQPVENVADLYRAATVFLSASRSEGFPYSVCEAMANGLPVVLSDIPGVAWAHRTRGALFFPTGDSSACAAAINEVLKWNPGEREENSAANLRLVTSEYDVTAWVDRILSVYERSLA